MRPDLEADLGRGPYFRFASLFFAVYVVLQHALRFAAGCKASGMSSSTSEALVLWRKWWIQVGALKVKGLEYLGVSFSSAVKMERERDSWFAAASAVMPALTAGVNQELS